MLKTVCHYRRLPMCDVIRLKIFRRAASCSWREILEQFDSRPFPSPQRRDAQSRTEHVVQVLLLGVEVLAFAGDDQLQGVAIKRQRAIRVGYDDGGVVDSEKQPIGAMPLLQPLVGRKVEDFEEVTIRIAKVECADTAG